MRPLRFLSKVLLLILVVIATAGAFWFGMVPQRWSPFSPLSLDEPAQWFIDTRLAALRRDPALCQAVLKTPHIEATPIPDNPIVRGCGWVNSVRVTTAGGAEVGLEKLTCEMAAALALWLEHDVQPLAKDILGQPVVAIDDMGTYSCRNIVGNVFWKDFKSQHATANALDIGGFKLADGRQVSIIRHWGQPGPEQRFLREVHRRGCRYFRVVLGPEFNKAHHDHFHLDRGFMWTCK